VRDQKLPRVDRIADFR